MKNIEVEIRGPLTKGQYNALRRKLAHEGKFVADKNRIAICYPDPETGSLVEQCNTDIRVRSTNGIPEIIIKKGKWGAVDENREEYSLVGQKGEFHKMIAMMAALGHSCGVAIARKGSIYNYKGVEFSVVEVPGHSYYFEAEIMAKSAQKKKALEKLRKICSELGLGLFGEQEFYDYINRLNNEANKEFSFADYHENYFKQHFGW